MNNKINFISEGSVTTPAGFKAAGITAGLKKSGKPDMALIVSDVPASAAGTFTTCKFAAAPVQICKKRIEHCSKHSQITSSQLIPTIKR